MEEPKHNQPLKPERRSDLPPPLKPANVLDSIFQQGGPMPAAGLGIRGLAFLLDFVLLTAVSMLLIWKFAIPQNHPGAFHEFTTWVDAFTAWLQISGEKPAAPVMSRSLVEALGYAQNLQFFIFWIYFAIGEAFYAGSSLGKRLCCIRTVSTVSLGVAPFFTGIVRAGLKTTTVFLLFPISILLGMCSLFFNKRRQLVHDLLSRTAVIDERLSHPKE